MSGRIDWLAAEKDYIANADMSYQDIANKYGVSKKQVGLRAKELGWPERRQTVHERALEKFLVAQSDHVAKVNHIHLLSYAKARTMAEVTLEGSSGDPQKLYQAIRALKLTIDGEREILGLNRQLQPDGPKERFVEIFDLRSSTTT